MANIFDLADLADVPVDLRDSLNIEKKDQFERNLIDLFEIAIGQELSLDQITVGYFRKYNEKVERIKLNAKLYNMAKSQYPTIESVPNKKGMYRKVVKSLFKKLPGLE